MSETVILTDEFARTAKPPNYANSWAFTDALVPGFELKVSRLGKRTFAVRVWQQNTRKRYKLGAFPSMLVDEARALAVNYKVQPPAVAEAVPSRVIIPAIYFRRLLSHLDLSCAEASQVCLLLWLCCPVTKAEACRARWQDLDLVAGKWHLSRKTVKLPERVLDVLRRRQRVIRCSEYVFSAQVEKNSKTRGHLRFPKKALSSALKAVAAPLEVAEFLMRTKGAAR